MNTVYEPVEKSVVYSNGSVVAPRKASVSGRTKARPRLSLVFPIYNESQVIPHLLKRVDMVVAELSEGATIEGTSEKLPPLSMEVICVNDGSRDDSITQLITATETRSYLRVIDFSRNFGHQAAVTAGMHHATGDAVALLDADLQDPPELLAKMIGRWFAGADVVYAVRTKREGESAFKKWTASQFYSLLRKMTSVDIPADTGDFRLMDRRVVDALNQMNESHRFLRGMSAWVGFKQEPIYYERPARAAGETKYPLKKMLRFAMDALTSFSDAPLKLATNIGIITALFALLYGGITVIRYFTNHGEWQAGWASIIALLTFLSGIQLITLGLVGEYIGRIYDEVKRRPLYLVSEIHGNVADE